VKDELRFSIQKKGKEHVARLEKKWQEEKQMLQEKIFVLENSFKDGKPIVIEEWRKKLEREVETLRDQNIAL